MKRKKKERVKIGDEANVSKALPFRSSRPQFSRALFFRLTLDGLRKIGAARSLNTCSRLAGAKRGKRCEGRGRLGSPLPTCVSEKVTRFFSKPITERKQTKTKANAYFRQPSENRSINLRYICLVIECHSLAWKRRDLSFGEQVKIGKDSFFNH